MENGWGDLDLIIRQEQASDYSKVYELVQAAFSTASYSDGTEADYLNEVRKKETFIPALSLVAEHKNGEILGQIVLYETNITMPDKTATELVLSPISVHPDYFRRGIARALMKRAFEIAKTMGYTAVFLCGEPEFYRKVGFAPTFNYHIYHINDADKNAEWCMVHELTEGTLKDVNGTVDIL